MSTPTWNGWPTEDAQNERECQEAMRHELRTPRRPHIRPYEALFAFLVCVMGMILLAGVARECWMKIAELMR